MSDSDENEKLYIREPVADQSRLRDSSPWEGLTWMKKSVSPLSSRLSMAHFRAMLLPWEKSTATPIFLSFAILFSSLQLNEV